METYEASVVDLRRLLRVLDARTGRSNVLYLELERKKRAGRALRSTDPPASYGPRSWGGMQEKGPVRNR